MKCSICKEQGHSARRCKNRPDAVELIEIPLNIAEIIDERVAPLIRVEARFAENIIVAIARSCYLQGAVDGQTNEVNETLEAYKRNQSTAPDMDHPYFLEYPRA